MQSILFSIVFLMKWVGCRIDYDHFDCHLSTILTHFCKSCLPDLEDKNTIYASCIIFMHIINLLVVCLFLMKWVGWTFWLSANYNNKLFYHHHAFPNFKRLFWPQESILDGWLYNPELMDSFSQIMLLHLYLWWYRWVVKMIILVGCKNDFFQ